MALVLAGQVSAEQNAQDAAVEASAFHNIGRAVRQTIALEMKLERDRKTLDREDSKHAAGAREAQVKQRRQRLRATVQRMVWTEIESDEAEALVDHLDDLLAEDALDEAFADSDFDDQVARLRGDLGLPPLPSDEEGDEEGGDDGGGNGEPDPPPIAYVEQPPSAAEIRAASG